MSPVKQVHQPSQVSDISQTKSIENSTHSFLAQSGGAGFTSSSNHHSIMERVIELIKDDFPKHARRKAVSLLRYLVNFGKGVFKIDESGALYLYGRKMNSGITDYIYRALLSDKFSNHQPEDFDHFIRAMEQINVPEHLLQKKSGMNSMSDKKLTKKLKWLPY